MKLLHNILIIDNNLFVTYYLYKKKLEMRKFKHKFFVI